MKKIGSMQSLEVLRFTSVGAYINALDETSDSDVLLPTKYVPDEIQIGDMIEVFLYLDSEERLIATTIRPYLAAGEIGFLEVVQVKDYGAFLNWGLEKDLFLPKQEQREAVKRGDKVLVMPYLDHTKRLCATMRIGNHLTLNHDYPTDATVCGTIYQIHDQIGVFVAVDNRYHGLIPKIACFENYRVGQTVTCRITKIHADGKLDLSTKKEVASQIHDDVDTVRGALKKNGGTLPYNDKTDAKVIVEIFKMSKRAFKRAVGVLLKNGEIDLSEDGIKYK